MGTLGDIFRILDEMRHEGVVDDYAVGGATAILFYAEPTRTYDLDVFVTLARETSTLSPLSGIYEWAKARGFATIGEHVLIHDVPVQFLPAHNALVADAVAAANVLDYEGVEVRVVGPEHLIALALQAGGARRRERAWQLLESGRVNREQLRTLLKQHDIHAEVPDDV
jgi:hypothetical protein